MRTPLSALGLLLLLGGCSKRDSQPGDSGPDEELPPTEWVVDDEAYPPGAPAVAWFREVTDQTGIDLHHEVLGDDLATRLFGAGIGAGDVDGDGIDDLVLAPGAAPPRLYLGEGSLQFRDASEAAGFGPAPASSVALADLDGDGDLDLVLGRDEMLGPGTTEATARMLLGDGAGHFSDVTEAAGLVSRGHVKALGIRDYDGDGLLDLYIAHSASAPTDLLHRPDELYRARGDGRFEEIGAELGLDTMGLTWLVAAFDAGGSGDPELFAGNDSFTEDREDRPIEAAPPEFEAAPDLLLAPQGIGAEGYPELAARPDPLIRELRSTMGAIAADFDGDHLLDLYLSDFGRNDLLLRQPDGSYLDDTAEQGLQASWRDDSRCPPGPWDTRCLLVSWGAVYEDLDLDGFRDLLVPNGQVAVDDGRQPVALWRGTGETGLAPVQSDLPWMDVRSMVAHDLDRDGDLDLVLATWGGPFRAFENTTRADGSGPSYVSVGFTGTSSAADGSGTRLAITDAGREVEIGTGGLPYSRQASELLFGLGTSSSAASTVRWPTGLEQTLDLPVDRHTVLAEPELFSLSTRVAPADGTTAVDIVVTPRGSDGALLGPGRTVTVDSSLGTWSGPVQDVGDGRYIRTLVAPAAPGLAVVRIQIEGTELWIRPRVRFD